MISVLTCSARLKPIVGRIPEIWCRAPLRISLTCATLLVALHAFATGQAPQTGQATASAGAEAVAPHTIAEARARSLLLHEMIHGALQVMHRDFFDDDAAGAIPSRSLEDVFAEMERAWDVRIRWMAVNTDAMNIDNQPQDDFERRAVEALADGAERFEATEESLYRFAGSIRLSSQCLKCHVQNRTSLEDRIAGLVITMPLQSAQSK